jgi:hypothetical protein
MFVIEKNLSLFIHFIVNLFITLMQFEIIGYDLFVIIILRYFTYLGIRE